MLCRLKTATLVGIEAVPVDVEVDVAQGLPGFHLVGLPNGAVREGGVRIKAALENSGYRLGPRRVTVNLAPADLRKDGTAFDLPIALGTLVAHNAIALARPNLLFAGELSLDGTLRPIRGALPLAERAAKEKLEGIVLPQENVSEARLVEGLRVYGAASLKQAADLIAGGDTPPDLPGIAPPSAADTPVDFAELQAQPEARRAAEVAAAGGHNLMLVGPPGSGKTMLARRLPTILPRPGRPEAIETTKIHSVAGLLGEKHLLEQRPFRAPHHGASTAGLVGGGPQPRPGEVSLAHNGVLFLDELPEFQRPALEALRQPLEDGQVTVVRARHTVTFPARFMLVAAMNPCPCGYRGSTVRTCTCGEARAQRYRSRISGPLLDRFDLFVPMSSVPTDTLLSTSVAESSATISMRVSAARDRQQQRLAAEPIHCNAQMTTKHLWRYIRLNRGTRQLLSDFAKTHTLSARALHRACRVARTIADLDEQTHIAESHICLALTLLRARWTI